MSVDKIETPRGMVIITEFGKAEIVWNPDFSNKWTNQYTEAQKWVDREVLRLSNKMIPMQTGMLKESGELGTIPGSGEVIWLGPYARYQYFGKVMVGPAPKQVTDKDLKYAHAPQRGAFWFERMKAAYKASIIAGAKRRAGGKE